MYKIFKKIANLFIKDNQSDDNEYIIVNLENKTYSELEEIVSILQKTNPNPKKINFQIQTHGHSFNVLEKRGNIFFGNGYFGRTIMPFKNIIAGDIIICDNNGIVNFYVLDIKYPRKKNIRLF